MPERIISRYSISLSVILLLLSNYAFAGNFTLSGKITEEKAGFPISDAKVILLDKSHNQVSSALTDKDGLFDISYTPKLDCPSQICTTFNLLFSFHSS